MKLLPEHLSPQQAMEGNCDGGYENKHINATFY